MAEIYIFGEKGTVPATISRLYGAYGSQTIEGHRLDCLTNVQILANSSTSTINQTGSSIDQAKTGSMLGRAAVGGALLGGTGAIVGGITGKRESLHDNTSIETLHTELTAELSFNDGTSLYVLLTTIEVFHWLLSFVGKAPLTDEELKKEEELAIKQKRDEEEAWQVEVAHAEVRLDKAKTQQRDKRIRDKRILIALNLGLLISLSYISPELFIALVVIGLVLYKFQKAFNVFLLVMLVGTMIPVPAPKTKTQPKNVENTIPKIKIDKKVRTKGILAQLKKIPVSEYKKNRVLYQELVTYNPRVELYQKKVGFYSQKEIEKEAKRQRNLYRNWRSASSDELALWSEEDKKTAVNYGARAFKKKHAGSVGAFDAAVIRNYNNAP